MNVEPAEWDWIILTTFKRISQAHCVVFDLELSGIPERKRRAATQTLQERYAELKEAAEKYHILQFGFTLVEEDQERDRYVLRTYNFNLSPLVDDVFRLERDFTYSSGAVKFLLGNEYDMNSPFNGGGLPYLKKSEVALARKNYLDRADRAAIPNVHVREEDRPSVEMVKRLKAEVDAWLKRSKVRIFLLSKCPSTVTPNVLHASTSSEEQYLFTGTPYSPEDSMQDQQKAALSSFHRRLVHQTIRNHYPKLTTIPRRDFVAIAPRNEQREAYEKERDERMLTQAMYKQRGFAIVADAMAGRKWAEHIDTGLVGRRIEGEHQAGNTAEFKERLKGIEADLAEHQTVLVGHNCLLDLVYIYHNFYGELPDTVERFQQKLHEIFPLIIDTKFMATVNKSYETRALQLSQIAQGLSAQEKPVIEDGDNHPVYLADSEKYHEAGYDSYQTAKAFLRLSSVLEGEGDYLMDELSDTALAGTTTPDLGNTAEHAPPSSDSSAGDVNGTSTRAKKTRRKKKENGIASDASSKFSHANAFDSLNSLDDETEETPASSSNAAPVAQVKKDRLVESMSKLKVSSGPRSGGVLPAWDKHFWNVYGNKLRCFGTVEEVCDLTQGPKDLEIEKGVAPPSKHPTHAAKDEAPKRSSSYFEALYKWLPSG